MNPILEKISSLPEDLRNDLDLKIRENWKELTEALMNLAKGVYYEKSKTTAAGATITRIYKDKPDKEVAQYLVNQVVGKPAQSIDITSGGKEVGVVMLPERDIAHAGTSRDST